jgi:hypothetical protein
MSKDKIYQAEQVERMINASAAICHTNVRSIARTLKMSPSNLYRKIRCNTLKPWEIASIARALGGKYVFYFSFPNGTKIGKLERSMLAKKNAKKKQPS